MEENRRSLQQVQMQQWYMYSHSTEEQTRWLEHIETEMKQARGNEERIKVREVTVLSREF